MKHLSKRKATNEFTDLIVSHITRAVTSIQEQLVMMVHKTSKISNKDNVTNIT